MHRLRFALYLLAGLVVVDGDTIKAPYGPTYRLLGYDSPETRFARCNAQRELGFAAKERKEELHAHGEVKLLESGTVTIDGKNLADLMIGEGLARPYHGERRSGWCGT